MKKVLILMAERTGTGHKSSANALEIGLRKLGYETKQLDCYSLMGKIGKSIEDSYIPITTKAPNLYYISYSLAQTFPNLLHFIIYILFKKEFKKQLNSFKPDLIISVHSVFTKSVSKILKKDKLNIPFYINVIDLVNPPNVWFDPNADMFFVPTDDIKNDYIKKGYDKNKIIISGFPIRDDIERRKAPKTIDDKINILLVNPSVNLKKNITYIKEISKLDNVSITVICGRDEKLYNKLIKLQKDGLISKNIKIYDFVKNMNEFLDKSHILLTKAGPNMLLEGAKSSTAIVVTGHIKGQENHNYEYVTKNNFGFKCENPNKIYKELKDFIEGPKLKESLNNVLKSECNSGTNIIVNYINEHIK